MINGDRKMKSKDDKMILAIFVIAFVGMVVIGDYDGYLKYER